MNHVFHAQKINRCTFLVYQVVTINAHWSNLILMAKLVFHVHRYLILIQENVKLAPPECTLTKIKKSV